MSLALPSSARRARVWAPPVLSGREVVREAPTTISTSGGAAAGAAVRASSSACPVSSSIDLRSTPLSAAPERRRKTSESSVTSSRAPSAKRSSAEDWRAVRTPSRSTSTSPVLASVHAMGDGCSSTWRDRWLTVAAGTAGRIAGMRMRCPGSMRLGSASVGLRRCSSFQSWTEPRKRAAICSSVSPGRTMCQTVSSAAGAAGGAPWARLHPGASSGIMRHPAKAISRRFIRRPSPSAAGGASPGGSLRIVLSSGSRILIRLWGGERAFHREDIMKTVLVVDDEPSVLFALSEGLSDRRRGVKVTTAASGVEAISLLEAERIDLVLTDLRMPEMDGFELLAYLRRNFAGLPVIVMTALSGDETADRLDGAVDCFTKPFNVPDLKARIGELLAQRVKGRVENITLPSFLQLLELERKTCTLVIRSLGRTGRLFFRGGRLVGAETGDLAGQPAALEIVTWEDADIEISDVCPPVEPEIEAGLSYLLMEGMRLQDERESGQPPHRATPAPGGEARPSRRRRPAARGPVAEALKRGRAIKGALGLVLVDTETGMI